MSRPCLIKIKTRVVLAKTGANEALVIGNAVPTIGVEISTEATQIDRSDVYTANGAGLPPIVAGRRFAFTITQELYEDPNWHAPLFKACAVDWANYAAPGGSGELGAVEITPSNHACESSGFAPATIEIVEVGGTTYRATNCTGTFTMTGEPGSRITLTFNMQGDFHQPADTTLPTFTYPNPGLPVLYKNSAIQWGSVPTDLTTCPTFTFTTGATMIDVPSACTPDGGGFAYPVNDVPAQLAIGTVASQKESVQKLWAWAAQGQANNLSAELFRSATSGTLRILLTGATLDDPNPVDLNGFVGHDLALNASQWKLEWIAPA